MKICKCGEEIHEKRYSLGIFYCLDCGSKKALKDTKEKAGRVMPLYDKGAYQLLTLGSIKELRQSAKRRYG